MKLGLALLILVSTLIAQKVPIKAIAIPLADHYAGIIAYEKYKDKMKYADYKILILPGPKLVRRYFRSKKDADIAFNVAPMVMDMYAKNPNFRWVSLIHRDGNALAVNKSFNDYIHLNPDKTQRKADNKVANAIKAIKKNTHKTVEIAVPSLLATHTTVLYKYLKDHNLTFSIEQNIADVSLRIVKPPKSIAYLKTKTIQKKAAAFEQSLPWVDIIETQDRGYIAWYSKDVMKHKNGHVECIIIAKDEVIKKKTKALKEVIYFIHKAGLDIERARIHGGKEFDEIISMIRHHIPKHTVKAIKESLRPDIMAINYKNLNVDANAKESFRKIMDLAFEAKFIKTKIDIDALADEQFSTKITLKAVETK